MKLRVAAVQMSSTQDKKLNLQRAGELTEGAAAAGAKIIALPEMFNFVGPRELWPQQAETIPGPTIDWMRALAKKHRVYIIAGSIFEKAEGLKVHNTSVLLSPDGELVGRYRKIHLFDVNLRGNVAVTESDYVAPGDTPVVFDTDYCRVGLTICYDLRFPELYRKEAKAGAQIIFVPSGFMLYTGRDHWMPLLQARAIENQVFLVAPDQVGAEPPFHFYGRSAIIDPWGIVLVCAQDQETAIIADLDFDLLGKIREELPSLKNTRLL